MTRDEINREVKYYQIREFETAHPESHDGVVSEEELKRRVEWIWLHPRASFNEITNVLLHGEDKPWPGPQDIIKMRGKPSPTREDAYLKGIMDKCPVCESHLEYPEFPECKDHTTRKEWEAWVNKMPTFDKVPAEFLQNWRFALRDWFRSMPIMPKE